MNRTTGVAFGMLLVFQFVTLSAQERKLSQYVKASPEVVAAVSRARVQRNQRNYDAAQKTLEDVLAKCRETKDRAGEVLALNNIASIHRYRAGLTEITEKQAPPANLIDKATTLHEQAIVIAREIGDKSNEGYASLYLGVLAVGRNEYEKAFAHYENALTQFKAIDDPEYIGRTYMFMGNTALNRQQKPGMALQYYEQCLP